jgi:hypothetical protein
MNQYPLKSSPRSTTGFQKQRNGDRTGRKKRVSVRRRSGRILRQVEGFSALPARTSQVRARGNHQVECERSAIRLGA